MEILFCFFIRRYFFFFHRLFLLRLYLNQDVVNLKPLLFYAVTGVFASIFASLIIARCLTSSLSEMTLVARSIIHGNFKRRVSVSGEDELAVLAKSFNELSLILGDRVEKLSEEKTNFVLPSIAWWKE